MDLDLDSFLRSRGGDLSSSSSGDDSSAAAHRRAVDEILFSAAETLEDPSSTFNRRKRNGELYSSLGFASSSSRPFPTLFGEIMPKPKPGAALAAAAAASRPIPTPHAAAIKCRRASSGLSQETAGGRDDFVESSLPSPSSSSSSSSGVDVTVHEVIHEEQVSSEREQSSSVIEREASENVKSCFSNSLNELQSSTHLESTEYLEDLPFRKDSVDIDVNVLNINENFPVFVEEAGANTENAPGISEADLETPATEADSFDTKAFSDGESTSVGEETMVLNELGNLIEERLTEPGSTEKVAMKSRAHMKPLDWAEELEKLQASSGLHWEEGAAAQPMRLEGIRRGPPAIGYLQMDLDNMITRAVSSQTFKHDCGSLRVLAVHTNFIAVGTSKGTVLVFCGKYSPHHADKMDGKVLTFGSSGEKIKVPVTSMCFNQQGDLLLVGYSDGHLAIWDVQRGASAKVITGEHNAPVTHTLFLGQDSQFSRQFKAVTGDSKGLVLLHTSSVLPLLNHFSIKTQCLLDGQKTGTVLCASPILMDNSQDAGSTSAQFHPSVPTSGLGSKVGGVVGGDTGWKLFNGYPSVVEEGVVIFATNQNALVVRLSPTVEVYEKLSRPDGVREGSMPYAAWKCMVYSHDSSLDASDKVAWLAIAWDRNIQVARLVKSEMKKYKEWILDSSAIGVAWLDDQMLVVLTIRGQLCLFSRDGSELHRTNFAADCSGMDDFIICHNHYINTFGILEKAYHNSVAVRGATIYILGPMHLIISRLLPWKERIQVLQKAGDWMGALDMAMRLYDGHAHGVIDLPRTVVAIREAIMPYLVELILQYVDDVFSYISVAFYNQIDKVGLIEDSNIMDSSVRSEIEEQYARVGGVAVEFCVHIKRIDILFDGIFSKFFAVLHGGTFLEILEPYILRDMLGCLPPEIMQALVEHYSSKGWLERVEQCVLHMDISSLDFNQVVRLCREHGLYGALIYLFNRGLDDFKAPLEELLLVVQKRSSMDVAAIGYRMLVYLKYCFQGLAFPPGHGYLPPSQLPSVRKELLNFLLEDSKFSTSQVSKRLKSSASHIAPVNQHQIVDSKTQHNLEQCTANALISILDLESDVVQSFEMDDNSGTWPSEEDTNFVLEFIAYLVASKQATISARVLKHILEYLTSSKLTPSDPSKKDKASVKEKQVLLILKSVPQEIWSSSFVLPLCLEAQFFQACGLMHYIRGEYVAALDSYMKDLDEPIHAFSFINKMFLQLENTEALSFKSAVILQIPELVKLSRECTFFLVIDQLGGESQNILSQLHSHPQSLFLFLKTLINFHMSGTLNFPVPETAHASNTHYGGMRDLPNELEDYLKKLTNFPKLLHHDTIQVTDEMTELYLELLCQYDRHSVLKFLDTFDNYRLENCLKLCQKYGVTDAAAFLLERVGDVGSALVLLLSGLDEKIELLVSAVENKFSDLTSRKASETKQLADIFKLTEALAVRDVVHASVGLCQRNTHRLDRQEAESLWFRLFDSFSEPLRKFCSSKEASEDQNCNGRMTAAWKFSKLKKFANLLRRLFSQFIGEIIEGMAGYLTLPAVMAKLLSDNGNHEFGDFKMTILNMLGTYNYERRILDTARSLIEDDTFYTIDVLKKGASHAFAPQNLICCFCGLPLLTKGSSSLGIRIFKCGHAAHLYCESEEHESPKTHSAPGCPVCQHKKNASPRSKSAINEDGLIDTSMSASRDIRGNFGLLHQLETDVIDKPYGVHLSRFDILNNLQKGKSLAVDPLPQLRLAPPAIYHEKVQKGPVFSAREMHDTILKKGKPSKRWQLMEPKSKGSSESYSLKVKHFWNREGAVH